MAKAFGQVPGEGSRQQGGVTGLLGALLSQHGPPVMVSSGAQGAPAARAQGAFETGAAFGDEDGMKRLAGTTHVSTIG